VVSTTFVDGALHSMQMCSSGKGDICPIGIEPLITNYGDDIRLKMFLARSSKFAYVIAVPDGSPISTLADFKGKTIGVQVISAAASGVFTTRSALAAVGLRATDYTLAPIGYEDEAANALASGQVAGAAFPYYEFIPFIVAGRKLRIFHHPSLENVANVGYAAAPSVLANRGNAVKGFSRAIVKASLLVRYNAAAAARFLLTAEGTPIADENLHRKTQELVAWEEDLPAADPPDTGRGRRTSGRFSSERWHSEFSRLRAAWGQLRNTNGLPDQLPPTLPATMPCCQWTCVAAGGRGSHVKHCFL
jgi:ABC-type nitrate/sulfonate/bicarbonate transport system substrate-binding protein